MKLKKPLTLDSETQYLTHCTNIATIIAYADNDIDIDIEIKRYIKITGVELEEDEKSTLKVEKKLCPRCHAEVEFAQDPLRICAHCGWRGDYTKLEEA